MLADYERNIGHRQSELDAIRRRKEELRRVEEMLQDIQVLYILCAIHVRQEIVNMKQLVQ